MPETEIGVQEVRSVAKKMIYGEIASPAGWINLTGVIAYILCICFLLSTESAFHKLVGILIFPPLLIGSLIYVNRYEIEKMKIMNKGTSLPNNSLKSKINDFAVSATIVGLLIIYLSYFPNIISINISLIIGGISLVFIYLFLRLIEGYK